MAFGFWCARNQKWHLWNNSSGASMICQSCSSQRNIQKNSQQKQNERRRLTSLSEVELCGPIGALTVVHVLHVAGVLVRSSVQGEAVSLERLQSSWVFHAIEWVIAEAGSYVICNSSCQILHLHVDNLHDTLFFPPSKNESLNRNVFNLYACALQRHLIKSKMSCKVAWWNSSCISPIWTI